MVQKSKTILNRHEALKLYAKAGVNEAAGGNFTSFIKNLTSCTNGAAAQANIGDFAGLFDLQKTNFNNPILVACSDGVGSKIKLATATNKHSAIGIDLVAMCVNDLLVKGATPLFFLDYFGVNKLAPDRDKQILSSIAKGCKIAGCSLLGGETAQLKDFYKKDSYELAGFALGAVEKEQLMPKNNLQAGDIILGLASSGLHANGFSLLQPLIKLEHKNDLNLAETLLTPTRIYVKSVLAALKKFPEIKAIAHITGGGIIGNLPRILTHELSAQIDLANFPKLPIFNWIAQKLSLSDEAMLSIFNCGIGLAIIVKAELAEKIKDFFKDQNETVHIIGKLVETATPEQVIIKNSLCNIIKSE
ncbi:phosphoribosylformylglycinamidine cyclo-ligase [Bartonella sp. TP]|uniref:phosphoribosylformylglycinamidine cyclo-ligase n=1 Tax=Bartonella sp. TP TaxID=3057550 RepID=UPI0025AEFF35|nr:phosphoribosylformylglycinamidine cyclo-ligase [Bartonella sp. TP]WJW79893.1 phosphoribosylformylglycinamidine cyclo-ligase [Bartonella sp. TP]